MIGIADKLSGANVSISLSSMHFHQGRMYEISYKTPDGSELADNAILDFLFRPNASRSHFSFGAIAADPIEILFYENPTITNVGASLSVVGLNRIRSIAPASVAYRSPTVSAVGDLIETNLQVWGLSPLVSAFAEVPWLLNQDTDYLIRVINRAGSAQDVGIIMQWFEAEW
jgi:hypothetical protein